jgi:hypothetical protein
VVSNDPNAYFINLGLNLIVGGQITQEYNMPGMKGFAGAIPDSFITSLQSLQSDGVIDSIGTIFA